MYILKQFYPSHKKHENTQRPIDTNPTTEEVENSNERLNESNIAIEEKDFSDEEQMNPEVPTKNKFLYPDEEYGKIGNDYSLNQYANQPDIGENNELKESNLGSIISIDDYHIVADESSFEESVKELDELKEEIISPDDKQIATVKPTKNKFLYPDDEFGKMEGGISF